MAAPPTVTVVPVATPAAAKPATPNIELYLHAIVIVAAICCLTVLGALKVIDGNTVGGEVAALGGVSAAVTTVATIRKGAASS